MKLRNEEIANEVKNHCKFLQKAREKNVKNVFFEPDVKMERTNKDEIFVEMKNHVVCRNNNF